MLTLARMKIISYNVNGIRAAFKKDFIGWLDATQPDVLCLQETKAQKEQVDIEAIEKSGYHHYWFSAQKKGYSGVALLCKQKPNHIEYGTGIEREKQVQLAKSRGESHIGDDANKVIAKNNKYN